MEQSNSVAEQLKALQNLQRIDSKLDEIKKLRGDLPEELKDLEDEIAGLETRTSRLNEEVKGVEDEIDKKKSSKKECEALIAKYKEQQMNVRNNREYDAITKEIELQELEIQIADKNIKEGFEEIEGKKEILDETKKLLKTREKDLDTKKKELEVIIAESQDEETKLMKERGTASKKVENRMLAYYDKLRANLKNGLAVVTVKKGAVEGSFIQIPPQKIAEIKEKKKIVLDEHSGRILADVEDIIEEEKPKRRTTRRKTTTAKTTKKETEAKAEAKEEKEAPKKSTRGRKPKSEATK